MDKFQRRDRTPSLYAFLCGYGIRSGNVSLFMNHGTFELKAINPSLETPEALHYHATEGWNDPYGCYVWLSFTRLKPAIKAYRKLLVKAFLT